MINKWILSFLLLYCMYSHANVGTLPHSDNVRFFLSANFSLSIAAKCLSGSVLSHMDGQIIKFNESASIATFLINREQDGLPEEFDLHDYPQIILGTKKIDSLPENIKDKFNNSRRELRFALDSPEITEKTSDKYHFYYACNGLQCTTFITRTEVDNELLMINSNGFTKRQIANLME
ncbi:hypothetical protein DXX93_18285 [Thalassotalea euphylliae]|uniref:Uncharacterized protein n=1 Tax=Thalassotalea euphylliae TaxID=1655234 RepID=A0A3E0TV45_9GAMM|nr:hypothetical protein [Thalassotalea euphylliae]REL28324.1 hypothetical protein DXX93_18285 [Thalassotalea euphylliae]